MCCFLSFKRINKSALTKPIGINANKLNTGAKYTIAMPKSTEDWLPEREKSKRVSSIAGKRAPQKAR